MEHHYQYHAAGEHPKAWEWGLGENYLCQMAEGVPLGKLGDPEDLAYVALFLASEEAKFVTGQTLIVDGRQILPEFKLAFA